MPKSGHTGRSLLSALLLKGIAIPILLSPIAIADEGAFGSEEMATGAEMAVGSPVTVADSAIADSDVSIDSDGTLMGISMEQRMMSLVRVRQRVRGARRGLCRARRASLHRI